VLIALGAEAAMAGYRTELDRRGAALFPATCERQRLKAHGFREAWSAIGVRGCACPVLASVISCVGGIGGVHVDGGVSPGVL
jgi:hypothetical protein